MTEIVKEITSDSPILRAQIVRCGEGLFRVDIVRWHEEHVPGIGKVFEGWQDLRDRGTTFSDTIERATEIARQELKAVVNAYSQATGDQA